MGFDSQIFNARHWMYLTLAACITAAAPAIAFEGKKGVPSNPDPCTEAPQTTQLKWIPLKNTPDTQVVVDPLLLGGPHPKAHGLIYIVNGNGFGALHYKDLATYYAERGYIVAIAMRPGGGLHTVEMLNHLQSLRSELRLPRLFPIALVGHSRGGGTVLEMAQRNFSDGLGFVIPAIVSIAPNVVDVGLVNGRATNGFLALYGSQDEDMQGVGNPLREGFAAYDHIGTEANTACTSLPCTMSEPSPTVDKAMVYVYGGDHGGFVGVGGKFPNGAMDYLDPADQLCVTKAYTMGLLRWKLQGLEIYKGLLRGDWTPASVAAIVSSKADYAGHPAGTPLNRFVQFSPSVRSVVADFQDAADVVSSAGMKTAIEDINASGLNAFRHDTRSLALMRAPSKQGEWAMIGVPEAQRDATGMDRLSLRIGQIATGAAASANPKGQDQAIWIGLGDGGGHFVYQRVQDWGRIPYPDLRNTFTPAHYHMNTVDIPLSAFAGIDLSDIRHVVLWSDALKRGEFSVDNIEFVSE